MSILGLLVIFGVTLPFISATHTLEGKTKFIFYDQKNREEFVSTSQNNNLEKQIQCYATKRYSIIVHGWRESCKSDWIYDLRQNLLNHRGGCIICMDYSEYSHDYAFMIFHFRGISKILTNKMIELRSHGFRSRDAFAFGFSFGSRLLTEAGINFGPKEFGTMHLCEPAGPGFDKHRGNAEPRLAALRSQCIHTASKGFGTQERNCHQNWSLGDCGEKQAAERPFPNGSHGLCPVIYNSAFKNKFMAVKKNKTCSHPLNSRDATTFPVDGVRMGYFQDVDHLPYMREVNLYTDTSRNPPYN